MEQGILIKEVKSEYRLERVRMYIIKVTGEEYSMGANCVVPIANKLNLFLKELKLPGGLDRCLARHAYLLTFHSIC